MIQNLPSVLAVPPDLEFLALHPFRVSRLRALTCLLTAVWAGAAAVAVVHPFPSPVWVQALLIAPAIYVASVGLYRSLVRWDQKR